MPHVKYSFSQLELKCGVHVDTWHDAIGGKSNGWWSKWIRNLRSQLGDDMWKIEGQKGELLLHFWLRRAMDERCEQVFKNGGLLDRESATSL